MSQPKKIVNRGYIKSKILTTYLTMIQPEDISPEDINSVDQQKDLELQKDILKGRKFSLAELIGKEGGDFLKGESPVPKITQLKTEINLFIRNNLNDVSGALQAVLQNWVNADDLKISTYQETPLTALSLMIEEIINNEHLYYEFVRQVDFLWGKTYDERPHFQSPGQKAHPQDEYTHESVRKQLIDLLTIINNGTHN
jgi:hypothetical protein